MTQVAGSIAGEEPALEVWEERAVEPGDGGLEGAHGLLVLTAVGEEADRGPGALAAQAGRVVDAGLGGVARALERGGGADELLPGLHHEHLIALARPAILAGVGEAQDGLDDLLGLIGREHLARLLDQLAGTGAARPDEEALHRGRLLLERKRAIER